MDLHRAAKCAVKSFIGPIAVLPSENIPGKGDQLLIALPEQPRFVQHRRQHAALVRTAAEAEDVDAVSLLVVAHQESVGRANVVLKQPRDRKIEPRNEPLPNPSPAPW